MIKIKDVKISFINRQMARRQDSVLDTAFLEKGTIFIREKNLRLLCAKVLKKAAGKKAPNVSFFVPGRFKNYFPISGCAKIIAQEIYRHLREDKSTLKHINVICEGRNLTSVFKNTITGYLKHLLNDLSSGPFVTVDTIINIKGGIVLIKRSNPPFGWALPGGFLDYGESLEQAASREAYEETGLKVRNLRQMHTYSKAGRDPRFQTITTVFVCKASGLPVAASDAQEARIFSPLEWKGLHLAFDHAKILSDYLKFK